MVLPIVTTDVLKLLIFDTASADVDGNVFILMGILEELADRVNRVPIEFLDSWGRESHGDDSMSNVGEVEIVPKLFETFFWSAYYLAQEIHFSAI